jgi:transaldolase/transaldolase/glucose-6-phosphate isomerase
LLWASTSTKDPAYPDTYYVEALIGAQTIDTVPIATFEAYRDHGHPASRLEADLPRARQVLTDLRAAGIELDLVTQRLEREGVRKFAQSYDRLLDAIARQSEPAIGRHAGA